MKVKKTIKVELNEVEKCVLEERVKQFTEGCFCEGIDCSGIVCSPDCPLYNLDEQAQALRKAVLTFIDGAE